MEFNQHILDKLNALEKNQEQMLTALKGNEGLGQKGLVHRIGEVEKISYKNAGDIKDMKTIKDYNVKRVAMVLAVMTVAVPLLIEVFKKIL